MYDYGTILRDRGDTVGARKVREQAIDVIETQRATTDTEASRIGFVGDKQKVYADLVLLLFDTGQIA